VVTGLKGSLDYPLTRAREPRESQQTSPARNLHPTPVPKLTTASLCASPFLEVVRDRK
jgi:hypothetical protein